MKTKQSTPKPTNGEGNHAIQIIRDWNLLKKKFLELSTVTPALERIPDKNTLKKKGLLGSIEFHCNTYYYFIKQLKEEGALSEGFDPNLRTFRKFLPMTESLEFGSGRELDMQKLSKLANIRTEEDCKRALQILLGDEKGSVYVRLQSIVSQGQDQKVGERDAIYAKIAWEALKFMSNHPLVGSKLIREMEEATDISSLEECKVAINTLFGKNTIVTSSRLQDIADYAQDSDANDCEKLRAQVALEVLKFVNHRRTGWERLLKERNQEILNNRMRDNWKVVDGTRTLVQDTMRRLFGEEGDRIYKSREKAGEDWAP